MVCLREHEVSGYSCSRDGRPYRPLRNVTVWRALPNRQEPSRTNVVPSPSALFTTASHLSSIALATEEARQRSTGGDPFGLASEAALQVLDDLGVDGVDGVVRLCQSLHLFCHRTTNASLHPFPPRHSPSPWLPASSPSARRTTTSTSHRAATSHDSVSRAHLFPDHLVAWAEYFNRPI